VNARPFSSSDHDDPKPVDTNIGEDLTMRRSLLAALLLTGLALFFPDAALRGGATAQDAIELRIATLAPQGSSWMRVFNAWNRSLQQATNNTVRLRFYPGGSQGDERDFVRKMRAGQLDGAAVTSTGLGLIVRPVLVLGAPGIFTSYAQIDRARDALSSTFEQQFDTNGYKLLGWGDVGRVRIFSQERIERPSDLRSRRPWAWRDDPLFGTFLSVVGANAVNLGLPEVYPALQTRMVDTVPGSALATVSLQWHTRLEYMIKQSDGFVIGATILTNDALNRLNADQKRALTETGTQAHTALQRLIRRDDDQAYRDLISRHGMTEVDVSAHEAEWRRAGEQTRARLVGRVFPQELLDQVIRARGR
jgi:TRAP-type transport system periplasmic protein